METSGERNEGKEIFISGGLTEEKLRKYEGFENLSDSEIKEQLNAIRIIARTLFEIYRQDAIREKENREENREENEF